MKKHTKLVLAIVVLIFSMPNVIAQKGSNAYAFQKLIGQSARNLDSDMHNEGYYHISTDKAGHFAYSMWWNSSLKNCLSAEVTDGRVKSVVNTTSADCNKPTNGSNHSYSSRNHKSYHYGGEHYGGSAEVEAAFERGFSDGKYHKTFHNVWGKGTPNKRNAYEDGYERGTAERSNKTSYHSGRGGYAKHVYVQDLVYQDSNTAYRDLKSRGFVQEKEHSQGGNTYRVWYNNNASQCIKTTSRDKKISSIVKSTHCN